jgi:hypothetical protein
MCHLCPGISQISTQFPQGEAVASSKGGSTAAAHGTSICLPGPGSSCSYAGRRRAPDRSRIDSGAPAAVVLSNFCLPATDPAGAIRARGRIQISAYIRNGNKIDPCRSRFRPLASRR